MMLDFLYSWQPKWCPYSDYLRTGESLSRSMRPSSIVKTLITIQTLMTFRADNHHYQKSTIDSPSKPTHVPIEHSQTVVNVGYKGPSS
jgi:hypothetical protein